MSIQFFNKPEQEDRRKRLRNEPTVAEWLLWQGLKHSQLGWKFRRQHGIGPYIVDFYCPNIRLVIEVDGDSHYESDAKIYDENRTAFLNENGIRVLRVTNLDVRESWEDVIELIREQCEKLASK